MLSSVSIGSSTKSVVMMFWYPRPAISRSPGLLEVPTASSEGVASGASTCSSPLALASACWGSGGGRSGSVVSALGAGSLGVGSSEASGSGAGVAVAGFDLCHISLADLMK
jgi:hypothetical protein